MSWTNWHIDWRTKSLTASNAVKLLFEKFLTRLFSLFNFIYCQKNPCELNVLNKISTIIYIEQYNGVMAKSILFVLAIKWNTIHHMATNGMSNGVYNGVQVMQQNNCNNIFSNEN